MLDVANDTFERYFAEKLWEMIPGIYRYEDGVAETPGVLWGLVQVIAKQAATLRRSQDRLWNDEFIDLCDDWAVPYIGDLLGTRMISARNARGRRADVAKTIYYRRRKGTIAVLEELIGDITGWGGTVVEAMRRLMRTQHGLDPMPAGRLGLFTQTPPGGWADLRAPRGSELTGSPFDELHHTPDLRRLRGQDGRYGINKIAFHLYRLAVRRLDGVVPVALPDGSLTFDPSGRATPLFMPGARVLHDEAPGASPAGDTWRAAREWELPAPMRCRLLNHAEYVIDARNVGRVVAASLGTLTDSLLAKSLGRRFRDEAQFARALAEIAPASTSMPQYHAILAAALAAECGKRALLPDPSTTRPAFAIMDGGSAVLREDIVGGDLTHGTASPASDKAIVVDPSHGTLYFVAAPGGAVRVAYHDALAGPVGAGGYDRSDPAFIEQPSGITDGAAIAPPASGTLQIDDSTTYTSVSDGAALVACTLQSKNGARPYVALGTNWVFEATTAGDGGKLTIDGLWIGGEGDVVLRGHFTEVTIRHATLDPGGTDAAGRYLRPVRLIVEGTIDLLTIASSITAPILTTGLGAVDRVVITDSILHKLSPIAGNTESPPAPFALRLREGDVEMRRVTVLGAVRVHRLDASELLTTRAVRVTDTQSGCIRFSAVRKRRSRLPHPYEVLMFEDGEGPLFTSRVFGQPGYGQLAGPTSPPIARGAENGSEIGVFSALLNPIKLDDLAVKVAEYMPFGLIPLFISET